MISSLRGTVARVSLQDADIVVGGVGMRVQAAPGTLAGLREGSDVTVPTSLVVREESLTLFGFRDVDERDVFETLQTVSGVGPRLALAMTAVLSPDQLRRAVADEDLATLQRVPGIGRKGAQRIVLEIGERLGPAGDAPPQDADAADAPAPGSLPAHAGEVVSALATLGWSEPQARAAVDAVLAADDAPPDGDVPALLRAALTHLGGGRRG
ncbi:Holliday junction branch migration protein RuvA [Georgenia sp. Z1491]|uniref:Holliday junction branch migration protein RuvA n=1 Tax=Georgenia sp. Z1491 TaxID=3416707 RepID=UPI003CF794AA